MQHIPNNADSPRSDGASPYDEPAPFGSPKRKRSYRSTAAHTRKSSHLKQNALDLGDVTMPVFIPASLDSHGILKTSSIAQHLSTPTPHNHTNHMNGVDTKLHLASAAASTDCSPSVGGGDTSVGLTDHSSLADTPGLTSRSNGGVDTGVGAGLGAGLGAGIGSTALKAFLDPVHTSSVPLHSHNPYSATTTSTSQESKI